MKIGSLFFGYGGLDLACEAFFDATTVWHADIDSAASRILAHHWPDVPNLGDITAIDWDTVEPIDVLTGGFPCQDVSAAGRRAGIAEGTRSGLWAHMHTAITHLRPRYVVIENVRGLLSARAHRPVEPESNGLGDHDSRPVLRALGAVLGDLADIGYDAQWCTVAAADVGACHRRERVFVLAAPADADDSRWGEHRRTFTAAAQHRATQHVGDAAAHPDGDTVRLEPVTEPGRIGAPLAGRNRAGDVALLPTPQAADGSGGKAAAEVGGYRSSGAKRAIDLPTVAARQLLPTPRATDGTKGGPNQRGSSGDLMLPSAVTQVWGRYAAAVARQSALSRPAPAPTEPNTKGNPRLSAAFPEWMMFLPAGWVTDPAIGLTRNEQLKAIGNGVVPPQAFEALRRLWPMRWAVAS